MLVYLRNRSDQTVVCAATLKQKLLDQTCLNGKVIKFQASRIILPKFQGKNYVLFCFVCLLSLLLLFVGSS